MSAKRDARRFYLVTLLDSLNFTLPIFFIIGPDYFNFSYVQTVIVMVGGVLLLGGLMQVPAGAWADRHGRKKAYLIGSVLTIVGFAPFFFTREFVILLLTIPVVGLGKALRDGSIEAIVSVSCEQSDEVSFREVTSHGMVAFYAGRVIGSPVGGILYAWHPLATIAANLIGFALSAIVVTGFKEVRRPPAVNTLLSHVGETIHAFSRKPDIWQVLGLVVLLFFAGDLIFTAYQPALADSGVSSTNLGFVFMAISLMSALGALLFRKVSDRVPTGRLLVGIAAAETTTAIGMATLVDWRILVALIMPIGGAMLVPLGNTYVAARSEHTIRATALSFVGLAWNVGTFSALIAAGLILDARTPTAVFVVGCAITFVALLVALASRLGQTPAQT